MPEPNRGCWLWLGWCDGDGYGKVNPGVLPGERVVHRIAHVVYVGPIPEGLSVLHRCDQPCCINPDHLFLGSHVDNMRDMIAKGRRVEVKGSRHGQSKLSEGQVVEMRRLAARGWRSPALAMRFGISPRNVRDVVARKLWSHVD